MNILALDCATRTGWACLLDGNIESGVQDFTKKRGESNGILFMRFNKWLREITPFNVQVIAFEQAHHRGGAPTEICVGLTTRVMEFAASIDAEYMAVHSASIKRQATGKGKASKADMMLWFERTVGRPAIDDNEADARALLGFIMEDLGVGEGNDLFR